jgi:hypothetical protein
VLFRSRSGTALYPPSVVAARHLPGSFISLAYVCVAPAGSSRAPAGNGSLPSLLGRCSALAGQLYIAGLRVWGTGRIEPGTSRRGTALCPPSVVPARHLPGSFISPAHRAGHVLAGNGFVLSHMRSLHEIFRLFLNPSAGLSDWHAHSLVRQGISIQSIFSKFLSCLDNHLNIMACL